MFDEEALVSTTQDTLLSDALREWIPQLSISLVKLKVTETNPQKHTVSAVLIVYNHFVETI